MGIGAQCCGESLESGVGRLVNREDRTDPSDPSDPTDLSDPSLGTLVGIRNNSAVHDSKSRSIDSGKGALKSSGTMNSP